MKPSTDPASQPHTGALRREIIGVLCVKAVALATLYWLFFAPSLRPHITSPSFTNHLLTAGIERPH